MRELGYFSDKTNSRTNNKENCMLKKFIERPVLSTVISIILLLLGGLSLFSLPITLFPDIAPPSVQVTAVYPGANAEVVARTVAVPIEEAVNGVENMSYM